MIGASTQSAASGTATEFAYIEVMACPGGCTNGGGQIRLEDARDISSPAFSDIDSSLVSPQPQPQVQYRSQKPSPHEQRVWLARVDEAYYSADSESEFDSPSTYVPQSLSNPDFTHPEIHNKSIHSILSYWSSTTNIPLSKLVCTTFRKVESDVGKNHAKGNSGGLGDSSQLLAGKIGGGW
jgi:hypothetical protein